MTLEWDDEIQDYRENGYTLEEQDHLYDGLSADEAIENGMFKQEDIQETPDISKDNSKENIFMKTARAADKFMGYTSPKQDKTYEDLGFGGTLQDIGAAVGNEASHIFQRREDEIQYEARTQWGELAKYGYRYIAGFIGVGKVGAALKAIQLGGKLAKGGKVLNNIGKFITADYNFLNKGTKAAKAGKIALAGTTEGFISDFLVTRPEEGEGIIGDMLPESENPIVQFMQTDETDTGLEYRFKKACEGLIMGIPLNFGIHGAGKLLNHTVNYFKNLKKVSKAATEEELTSAIRAAQLDEVNSNNLIKGQSLINNVQSAFDEAMQNNANDIERFVLNKDFVNNSNKEDVLDILNKLQKGQEIVANEDGSFSIQVNKWQDAADVSIDELKAQTNGDGVQLMNDTVRDTWKERNWLDTNQELITTSSNGKPIVNTQKYTDIAENYKQKWGLNADIKFKFEDGKINGADANTTGTRTEVPVKKDTKAKAELKVKQLEEKIIKAENKNVQGNIKNLKINQTPMKQYIRGRYKNRFFTKDITDPLSKGINEANTKMDKLIDEISKNPLQVQTTEGVEALENWVKQFVNFSDKDLEQVYWDRFYEVVEEAQNYKPTNNTVIENLKQQLEIAKAELNQAPEYSSKILIRINKNADNPYAILRSELEHARDIARGEVPDQSVKHFNRYEGMNESEMSLGYVKKKADTRAGKTVEQAPAKEPVLKTPSENLEEFISNPERTWTSVDTVLNDEAYKVEGLLEEYKQLPVKKASLDVNSNNIGKTLGYLEFDENNNIIGIVIDSNLSKDDAEFVLLHEIRHAQQLKDQSKEAIEELVNITKKEDMINYHNSSLEKDADRYAVDMINKKKDYYEQQRTNVNAGNSQKNGLINKPENGSLEKGSENNRGNSRIFLSENEGNGVNTTGNSTADTRPLNERAKSIKSEEEANAILDEAVQTEKEVIPWKVTLENAEDFYQQFKAKGLDTKAIREAISNNDVELANMIAAKQLASERLIKDIANELLNTTDKARYVELYEAMTHLANISKKLSSASGRTLNAQKVVNKARQFFSLTTLEEEGLQSLADLLSVDIKSLNFTRNISDLKKELYQKISKYNDGIFFDELTNDTSTLEAFDGYLTQLLKDRITEPTAIIDSLRDFVQPLRMERVKEILSNCTDDSKIGQVVRSLKANGGVESYIVHNLLGNIGTTIANVLSGINNSIYFPTTKIVGGFIEQFAGNAKVGDKLIKEGVNTLTGYFDSFMDSWALAMKAFKTGEGQMISLGKVNPADVDSDVFTGFREWGGNDAKEWLQNMHSFFTRVMGASDELLTQLNYRAIAKAQARNQAEEAAELLGKSNDITWIEKKAKQYFINSFDETGKPLNMQAYAEARDIVYQTPLSGKYWDSANNEYVQVKAQSITMKAAEAINNMSNKFPALRLFFPFVRTPANIMQQSLEHNPLYAILSPSQRNLVFGKGVPVREQRSAQAKVVLGTMSIFAGYLLAMSGRITGTAPLAQKERQALYNTGWRPYSINIGGKYYSYSRVEPLATILGFGADMFHLSNSYNPDENMAKNLGMFAQEGMSSIVSNTFDKAAFTNGINQLQIVHNIIMNTDNTRGDEALKLLRPLLPASAFVTNMSTIGKTEQTKPEGLNVLWNKYLNRGLGDYRRNVFGERQDMYNILISTGLTSTGNNEEDIEIKRLAELGWQPSELTNNEYGSGIKYKEFKNTITGRSFYDAMNEELSTIEIDGKTLREAVRECVTSDEYQALPDGIEARWGNDPETKKNYISTIFNEYKKAARNKVIDERGEDFVNADGLNAREQKQKEIEQNEADRLNASINETMENIRSFS